MTEPGDSVDTSAGMGVEEALENRGDHEQRVEVLISELRKRTAELEEANRELRRVSHYRSLFLARMSHELRTPLTSILGFSEILLDQEQLTETQRRFCQKVQDSGFQLQASLNQLVDLSRLEAGQTEVFYQEFSLRETLRESLIKDHLVSEEVLSRFDSKKSDISLAQELTIEGLLNESQSAQAQLRQVSDVLRLSLRWTEGTWEFDSRSQLSEEVPFKVNWEPLVLDAGRRISPELAASRLSNLAEVLSPVANPTDRNDLQPTEVFLLSRLDQPTSISDLTNLSGLPEGETLRLLYALALSGLIQRKQWKQAIQGDVRSKPAPTPAPPPPPPEAPAQTAQSEAESLQRFLERLDRASTHYQVLAVATTATTSDIKRSYYEVARRYHPDRFRKEGDTALNARIEAAFARVTQAYETLREEGPRATYDSKLDAQRRVHSGGEPAKTTSTAPPPPAGKSSGAPRSPNEPLTDADRAEEHFKEGFAAKQMGQINTAIGMFSAAARLAPNDARYRAYYGQALATNAATRRLAEAELQVALKLDPENGDYRTMLAELYRDLGFAVRARSEIEKVLKAAPDHQKARELLRSLGS